MSNLPVGILLAAGESRRFGSNKLLHPISDDRPMLLVIAKKLVNALANSIAVINQDLMPYTRQLEQLGMRVVINQQAHRGMGSSIACGVRASQDAAGWLIALADMPYVNSETMSQLSNRLSDGSAMVAPLFEQQRGHPVGFNQCFKQELMALNDDVGARHIIASHQNRLELIPTRDAGVIRDIDQFSDVYE
ncbi:MAG: nucleotidyltransferase family protein [Gammaproteobacteria bacterium]